MSLDVIDIVKIDEDNIHDLYTRHRRTHRHPIRRIISVYTSFEYSLGLKKDANMNRSAHIPICATSRTLAHTPAKGR